MNGTPTSSPGRRAVSLSAAGEALRDGAAVVLPNPAPLTHIVTARQARAVNAAKGRPADQPVALWAHHPRTLHVLEGVWRLGPAQSATARRLLSEEHLTVLVPVHDHARTDTWSAPAVRDGWMLLFGARWRPLRSLLDDHPVLYVSSANRTGLPPVSSTAEALAMFPASVAVLGPFTWPCVAGPSTLRRATTTVRLSADGGTELHRHGAQDQSFATPGAYLLDLEKRYARGEQAE